MSVIAWDGSAERKSKRSVPKAIVTRADYESVYAALDREIERLKSNPAIGREILLKTGMYDSKGKLKREFR